MYCVWLVALWCVQSSGYADFLLPSKKTAVESNQTSQENWSRSTLREEMAKQSERLVKAITESLAALGLLQVQLCDQGVMMQETLQSLRSVGCVMQSLSRIQKIAGNMLEAIFDDHPMFRKINKKKLSVAYEKLIAAATVVEEQCARTKQQNEAITQRKKNLTIATFLSDAAKNCSDQATILTTDVCLKRL